MTEHNEGGYLVPKSMDVELPGRKAKAWRFLGLKLKRHDWYLRGMETIDYHAALKSKLKQMGMQDRQFGEKHD